jgi:hypothetical protein
MGLITAKQGQLQASTKTVQGKNNIIKYTNDVRDQEIILKNKSTFQMHNMKPTEYGQRKVKRKSNLAISNVIECLWVECNIFLLITMSLKIALAAESYLAEGLT